MQTNTESLVQKALINPSRFHFPRYAPTNAFASTTCDIKNASLPLSRHPGQIEELQRAPESQLDADGVNSSFPAVLSQL